VKTPSDFLKSIRGRPVVVKLNSGVDYRDKLKCLWLRRRSSSRLRTGGVLQQADSATPR
jgi:hypothetical protein